MQKLLATASDSVTLSLTARWDLIEKKVTQVMQTRLIFRTEFKLVFQFQIFEFVYQCHL